MSSQHHAPLHRPRPPAARHPLAAASAPGPLPHHPVPSTPPPSYTPKDPFAPDQPINPAPTPFSAQPLSHPHPLLTTASASTPSLPTAAIASRRASNPADPAPFPAFSSPHQQQPPPQPRPHRRPRSSTAAARIAAASASAPDLPPLTPTRSLDRPPTSTPRPPTPTPPHEPATGPEPPSSALHPRIAVLLGINESFHVPLLLTRALATAPAIYWFGRCGCIAWDMLSPTTSPSTSSSSSSSGDSIPDPELATEVLLAGLWCITAGYLSFYFADCLMSRWLLNYTPAATLVRLFTISALNVYTASTWLHLSGAATEPSLLLPAWIAIACALTVLYHGAHRKVNIRRETRAAVRAFWVASMVSLWVVLGVRQGRRGAWRRAPVWGVVERVGGAWREAARGGGGGGREGGEL